RDWSSDVCSSDLGNRVRFHGSLTVDRLKRHQTLVKNDQECVFEFVCGLFQLVKKHDGVGGVAYELTETLTEPSFIGGVLVVRHVDVKQHRLVRVQGVRDSLSRLGLSRAC